MTGPEHYAEAERLLAVADRHTRSVIQNPIIRGNYVCIGTSE